MKKCTICKKVHKKKLINENTFAQYTDMTDWKEKFREQFVFEDKGPDGDGYDADLPVWNDYFHGKDEFGQIEALEQFIQSFLSQEVEKEKERYRDKIKRKNKRMTEYLQTATKWKEQCLYLRRNIVKRRITP